MNNAASVLAVWCIVLEMEKRLYLFPSRDARASITQCVPINPRPTTLSLSLSWLRRIEELCCIFSVYYYVKYK